MKRKKKLEIKYIQKVEQVKCSNCSHFLKLNENIGICDFRYKVVYSNFNCPNFKEGDVMEIDLDKLAQFYEYFKEMVDEYKKNADLLRDMLITKVKGRKETKNFKIIVTEVKVNRLNTEKVREYLKRKGILDKFTTTGSYYRVEVKRKMRGGV